MRNDRQFQQVLDSAYRAAVEHNLQQQKLYEAMLERYGTTHSDVDADFLIDPLGYGQGLRVLVADCDRIMSEAGCPRIRPQLNSVASPATITEFER